MQRPELPPEVEQHLRNIVRALAKRHGMERLPEVECHKRGATLPMTSTPAVTAQTEIRTDWQLSITVDMVLRGQGVIQTMCASDSRVWSPWPKSDCRGHTLAASSNCL
jgi:hypothetical protein